MRIQNRTGGLFGRLLQDTRGVSSTELGVLLALVALGGMQAMSALGGEVKTNYEQAGDEVSANRFYADPFARGANSAAREAAPAAIPDSGRGAPEAAPADLPPPSDSGRGAPEPAPAGLPPEW